MNRRSFFGAAGMVACAGMGQSQTAPPKPFRIAHLTDTHVQPELSAAKGMAACLRHVQESCKPDLILFGGDNIMDAFEQTRERTVLQWNLWNQVLKAENSLPTRSCIGNHDIWGWNRKKSSSTGQEKDYGKKWAVEALGLPHRYYRFSAGGWEFIALDGVQPGAQEGTYSAYLDPEQWDWLQSELKAIGPNRPTLIWSHIPIVSAMPLLEPRQQPTSPLSVSAGTCHTDAQRIVDLLASHPQVKLCLSGHLHQVDHLMIKGVNFHCNGAVSGGWWKGLHRGFPEGYAVVDLHPQGTAKCSYVPYGWKAESPPASPGA